MRESVDQLRVSLDKAITAYGDLLSKHGLAEETVPAKKSKKVRRRAADE